MKKGLISVCLTILAIVFIGCNGRGASDVEIARAKAEAETARLRIEAARAEAVAAEAKKDRLRAEIQAREEQRRQEAENQKRQALADSEIRSRVEKTALQVVQRNGTQILNKAYPMAFSRLKYTSANLVGTGKSGNGYVTTIRLNYRNLLRQRHYLDITFDFDSGGGYLSNRIVNHSDVVAPGELTLGSLMKLAE